MVLKQGGEKALKSSQSTRGMFVTIICTTCDIFPSSAVFSAQTYCLTKASLAIVVAAHSNTKSRLRSPVM